MVLTPSSKVASSHGTLERDGHRLVASDCKYESEQAGTTGKQQQDLVYIPAESQAGANDFHHPLFQEPQLDHVALPASFFYWALRLYQNEDFQ